MKFKSKKPSKLEAAVAILTAEDGEKPTISDYLVPAATTEPQDQLSAARTATTEASDTVPTAKGQPKATDDPEARSKKQAEKAAREAEREEKRRLEMEGKYPHVVPGSLRLVPKGEVADGVTSKGRMVTVACVDCGTHRTVNVQDAFQSKRCRPCYQAALKRRQKDHRAESKAKAPSVVVAENAPKETTRTEGDAAFPLG